MAWQKAGVGTVTTSDIQADLDTPFTFLFMLLHSINNGAYQRRWRQGNGSPATGSVYASRKSTNGGSETTVSSGNDVVNNIDANSPQFQISYYINKSAEEKLGIAEACLRSSTGGATAPERLELVWKHANTSNQDDSFEERDDSGTQVGSDSQMSFLGTD